MAENELKSEPKKGSKQVKFFYFPNAPAHQHYRDRNPPWIKLYKGSTREDRMVGLQDASKLLAPFLESLASERNGVLPYDVDFLRMSLQLKNTLDESVLAELEDVGIIAVSPSYQLASKELAECYQNASKLLDSEYRVLTTKKINKKTAKEVVFGSQESPFSEKPVRSNTTRNPSKAGDSGLGGAPPNWEADFAVLWAVWPAARRGTKKTAEKQYLARLRQGHEAAEIQSGADRYLASKPFGIKLLATFLGPDLHFQTPWSIGDEIGSESDGSAPPTIFED